MIKLVNSSVMVTSVFCLLLVACQDQNDSTFLSNEPLVTLKTGSSNQYIITQQDLPLSDQIQLYNMQFQLHELTLSSTREVIEKNQDSLQELNWTIPTPIAPKANINVPPSWVHGQSQANENTIKLDILCSYASRPCATLMKDLDYFLTLLNAPYQIRFYDFPQTYHHAGFKAAAAVACLSGKGKQQLKNSLWIRQGQVEMPALTGAIDLYSDNPRDSYDCMNSQVTQNTLNQQIKQLKSIGLTQTPSVLLNGQYLARGYESRLLFQALLPHMKLQKNQQKQDISLLNSWINPLNQHNWALIKHQGKAMRVTSGSQIGDSWVAQIVKDNISVIKQGELIWLNQKNKKVALNSALPVPKNHQVTIENQQKNALYQNSKSVVKTSNTNQYQDNATLSHQERYEKKIKQLKARELPQDWLEKQLMRQSELEDSLHLTQAKIEDKSLVKLNASDIDDFYNSLGLQPGDVIMRVNDEWVHEENNPLFQTLRNEERITLSVMRKGLPIHLAFEISP